MQAPGRMSKWRLDLLAEAGMRVWIAPMFRSGHWHTARGHLVDHARDAAAGNRFSEAKARGRLTFPTA
jgi:hypothetical protein